MRRFQVLLAALGLGAIWQILSMLANTPLLPPPWQVVETLVLAVPQDLGLDFLASLWRVVASILLAVATAAPLGVLLGQSRSLSRVVSPMIYLLYPVPKVVLVPVVLLFLGIGDTAKIAVIFLILFFQILVLVRDQAAALRPELLLSVRSLGAGRRALYYFIYFPSSLPAILTAVRQCTGTAVAVLYVAELFATRYGLGYYIFINSSSLFNYPAMYAGILAMSFLGLGLYFGVDWLERRLCPWLPSAQEEGS